jgi:hypothetical protein
MNQTTTKLLKQNRSYISTGGLNLNVVVIIVIVIVAIVIVFGNFRFFIRIVTTGIIVTFIGSGYRGLRGARLASPTSWTQISDDTVVIVRIITMQLRYDFIVGIITSISTSSIRWRHVKRDQANGLIQRATHILAFRLEQILVSANYRWSQLQFAMQTNEGATGRNTQNILTRIAVHVRGKLCQLGPHHVVVERDRGDVECFRHGALC